MENRPTEKIRTDQPFVLHFNGSVIYDGRAESTLTDGDYILLRKGDGTFTIIGATNVPPLNYQRPRSILRKEDNNLISTSKDGETVKVKINKTHHYYEIHPWSDNKIIINKTEDDLRRHIIAKIEDLIGEPITKIHIEFKTPYGPVDLIAEGSEELYHVIEIKRGKATISACTQVERYLKYFKETDRKTRGWVMSPTITKGAKEYCRKNYLTWALVKHH
jgi:RecB family endonuclease NucS